jgi:hypothetical protein
MASRTSCRHHAVWGNSALAVTVLALALACGSRSHDTDPVDGMQASGGASGAGGSEAAKGGKTANSGAGRGGGETAQGGNPGTGGATAGAATAGAAMNGSLTAPPCNPADNTLAVDTGDLLTDLPSMMQFSVFDPPTSKNFTGSGSKGDVRVYLPEAVETDRVFPTATVVDPLDNESANIELVLASGFVNARYVVGTGDKLYAQVTANRVVLTFCEVDFVPASDPPGLPVITVTGRMLSASR